MCQAYEGEAAYLRAKEQRERELHQLNTAYNMWLVERWSSQKLGNLSMREIDEQHRAGMHDEDFKSFLNVELKPILERLRT